jgi:hypothetical protein
MSQLLQPMQKQLLFTHYLNIFPSVPAAGLYGTGVFTNFINFSNRKGCTARTPDDGQKDCPKHVEL